MERPEPSALVICDAGPLIHLDELGCLALLSDFEEVCVPEAVWQEVEIHRPSALRRRSVSLNRIDVIPEATEELASLLDVFALHAGEMEALRLMHQFPEATLLTDDAVARGAAIQLGYEVHGTIGMLVRALRTGQRSKRRILTLLREIPHRSTLHIARDVLNTVLEQVQESTP